MLSASVALSAKRTQASCIRAGSNAKDSWIFAGRGTRADIRWSTGLGTKAGWRAGLGTKTDIASTFAGASSN